MKTYNKITTSKLMACFDNELRKIIMEDLKAFRDRNKFIISNERITMQHNLTAA